MKNILYATCAALCLLRSAFPAASAEGDLSICGSLVSAVQTGIGPKDAGINGYESELRLVLEGSPEQDIDIRAEGGYEYVFGLASLSALSFDAGLAAAPEASSLPPDTDLHRSFFIDQAWARAVLDRFTLKTGIVPVGWGTGYLYNPTSRTVAPEFPGEDLDTLRGKPGVSAVIALPGGFALEGYALADARMTSPVPEIAEVAARTFPFGAKLQARSEALDLSFSLIRELPEAGAAPRYWYGADAAGNLGPVNIYAEAVAEKDDAEISAGFSWTVPGLETVLRSEYIRLHSGASSRDEYAAADFLAGNKVLLGRNYLFAGLEKEDGEAARWKLAGGGLFNLNDRSAALSVEARWFPRLSLELSAFARYFTGSGLDEFGGERPAAPNIALRAYRGAAGLSAKWSF